MATTDADEVNTNAKATRLEKFYEYNPFARRANQLDGDAAAIEAQLAIAYAIEQLRTEIHFAGKSR